MAFGNWGDLKKFDDGFSFNNVVGTNLSGNNEDLDNGAEDFEVSDWNEMRKFDDDHDDDWFKVQEKKLAEQYGGNFLKVKYCNNGRVAYFCELCLAECSSKVTLEQHCNGMKHLKKKDLWEKEGRPKPSTLSAGGNENSRPAKELSPEPIPPSHLRPPSSKGKKGGFGFNSYDRKPYDDTGRGGGGYDRFLPPKDPYYQPFAVPYPTQDFSVPPPTRSNDLRDTMKRRSSERDNDLFSRDHGRTRDYGDKRERRGSPERSRYYGDKIESRERDFGSKKSKDRSARSRSREKNSKRSRSKERGSKRSRSRERRKSPDSRHSRRSPYKNPPPPSPPKVTVKPTDDKTNLVTSPAGSLLQKLAGCCIKTDEDVDLAMSVVTSLLKSLKDHSTQKNEQKISELLTEAELKVGTIKALKVGMKMLSSFAYPSATSGQTSIASNIYSNSTNVQGFGNLPYYKM